MPARADQRDRDLNATARTVDRRDAHAPFGDDIGEAVVHPLTFRPVAQKGRGAIVNVRGRYEVDVREHYEDGWDDFVDADDEPPPLKTIVTDEHAKTILSRNDSPDIPFRVSLNPYRGCEHGCIYCFARPTHSYLGLSPGLDFESRLYAKVNAASLLIRELGKPSYVPDTIAVGVNTDAYQPIERDLKITRAVLQVLHDTRNPFGLITKSSLIERDLDLLVPLAAQNLARASITITTLDHALSRKLEPRAASPARRLRTVRTLVDAGVPVSVNVSPVIPFITDHEMEHIVAAAAEAGAHSAHFIILRLPWELNEVFQTWLRTHFPLRAERVMNRIRDMRGGKDYDARFGKRMTGQGIWAELFAQRFHAACARHGLNRARRQFDASHFVRPIAPAHPTAQQRLFD
ncbi:MAG: PA0069 family radical SAM protein [Burkholderiaceae bacterium]